MTIPKPTVMTPKANLVGSPRIDFQSSAQKVMYHSKPTQCMNHYRLYHSCRKAKAFGGRSVYLLVSSILSYKDYNPQCFCVENWSRSTVSMIIIDTMQYCKHTWKSNGVSSTNTHTIIPLYSLVYQG